MEGNQTCCQIRLHVDLWRRSSSAGNERTPMRDRPGSASRSITWC